LKNNQEHSASLSRAHDFIKEYNATVWVEVKEKQKVSEECKENGKMERSEAKAELKGSPAGRNNTRQNAVGHPSPRFSNRREIVTNARERPTKKREVARIFV